jgi:hypothetical protein
MRNVKGERNITSDVCDFTLCGCSVEAGHIDPVISVDRTCGEQRGVPCELRKTGMKQIVRPMFDLGKY